MKRKVLMLSLALALVAVLALSATLAYFTDTDSAKNTMVFGNVDIAQLEYERVVDENGNWVLDGTTDKYGYTPEVIQPFTQDKPLFPAFFEDGVIKYDDRETSGTGGKHQQSWAAVEGEKVTGAPGSLQLFDDSVKNVIDKFVFVENTGKSDAYVRTLVALEQGSIAYADFDKVIKCNSDYKGNENPNGHWDREDVAYDVVIGDSTYVVMCFTYVGPNSNPTGILAPGTISYPNLAQVYMKPEVTQEQVVSLDGNANGKYDILVLSQAVQTTGFDNADTALTTAFGDATDAALLADWFADVAA